MNESAASSIAEVGTGARITIALGENLEPAELTDLLATARAASDSGHGVVVDARAPDFLPTAAVQILAALQRSCRERGVSFVVAGVQESAAAYLRLAGLDAVLRS